MPFTNLTWVNFRVPAWISNYIYCKASDEITYTFPNFNGCTVEVWEWISNSIIHLYECSCSSMLKSKLIHVSKKGPLQCSGCGQRDPKFSDWYNVAKTNSVNFLWGYTWTKYQILLQYSNVFCICFQLRKGVNKRRSMQTYTTEKCPPPLVAEWGNNSFDWVATW